MNPDTNEQQTAKTNGDSHSHPYVLVEKKNGLLYFGRALNARPPTAADAFLELEDVWQIQWSSGEALDREGRPGFRAALYVGAPFALCDELASYFIPTSEIGGFMPVGGLILRQLLSLREGAQKMLQQQRAQQSGIVLPPPPANAARAH